MKSMCANSSFKYTRLEISSYKRKTRYVKMVDGFFKGYRQNILEPDELLISLFIPKTSRDQFFVAYKQAKRREDDIAIVNMALNVTFEPNSDVVENIAIAYGGMAQTVLMVPKFCSVVIGKRWNHETVEILSDSLVDEVPLNPSAPGGMIVYRRSLTLSLLFKAFLEISQTLDRYVPSRLPISEREKSGADLFHTLHPESNQVFQKFPGLHEQAHALNQPIVHTSAFKQATGEATYLDDIPKFENELFLAMVWSTKAHAYITSIDASEALRQTGVHAFFSAKDLTAQQNAFGPIVDDEEVFISSKVTSQCQILGAIVADNQSIAQKAARLVRVEYEDISPIIITIEDAIANNSFLKEMPLEINFGSISDGFEAADVIVDGECRMGGQEHFYLETNACIAIPRDLDEMEIISSCQHIAGVQTTAAKVLGVHNSQVFVRSKRIGGGFGGKESRNMLVMAPVVVAAQRLNRPVRCVLDRDEDMAMSGTRHPFLFKYKAGATRDGKLTAFSLDMYSNGGCSTDFSIHVSIRYILFINFYKLFKYKSRFLNVLCFRAPILTIYRMYLFGVLSVALTYLHVQLFGDLVRLKRCLPQKI